MWFWGFVLCTARDQSVLRSTLVCIPDLSLFVLKICQRGEHIQRAHRSALPSSEHQPETNLQEKVFSIGGINDLSQKRQIK